MTDKDNADPLGRLLAATAARRQQPLPTGKFAPDVRFPDSAIADLAAGKSLAIRQGDLYLVTALAPKVVTEVPIDRRGLLTKKEEAAYLADLQPVLVLAPDGFRPFKSSTDENLRELVHADCSRQSSHKLRAEDLTGLTLYQPAVWDSTSFIGPYFRHATREVVVEHQRHGNVIVPVGLGIQCIYQREYDPVNPAGRRVYD